MNFIVYPAVIEIFGDEAGDWTLDEIKEELEGLETPKKAEYEKLVTQWLADRGITLGEKGRSMWFEEES